MAKNKKTKLHMVTADTQNTERPGIGVSDANSGNAESGDFELARVEAEKLGGKIERYQKRRTFFTWAALIIAAVLIVAYFVYTRTKTFTDYEITGQTDREDTSASHFVVYGDGFIKYSNDGASYTDRNDIVYWNQGFEMQNPILSIGGDYVALADREGEDVYVMDTSGAKCEIRVNMPITDVETSSAGYTAVMMEESGASYLALFDQSGNQVAEGAIHADNGGMPIDITLSSDGKKLAVAVLDISKGVASSTIQVYNFGSVGQNEIDNIVVSDFYEGTVITKLAYVSDKSFIAFGDNKVYVYNGSDTPSVSDSMDVSEEIQSVFYNENYFGLVYANLGDENGSREIHIYDYNGNEKSSFSVSVLYDEITFLSDRNNEICMYNSNQCEIYTLNGREKMSCQFSEENSLWFIMPELGYRAYYIITDQEGEDIRLRLFDFDITFPWEETS